MVRGAFALIGICAPGGAVAAPSAEVAKKCMHFSYLVYPYNRPGSVKMSSNRQSYFKDCMSKEGNVPEPPAPKEQ
jgi:hypothetical protein